MGCSLSSIDDRVSEASQEETPQRAGGPSPADVIRSSFERKSVVLNEQLGRGGYGRVYKAIYNGAPAAVKVIDMDNEDDEKRIFIMNETRIGLGMFHPNVIKTYQSLYRSSPEGTPQTWIVMELCEHGSVSKAMRKKRYGLNHLAECMDTLIDVAQGMAYLHKSHVIHGDLNANNVLLDKDDVAKVCDFGLSRAFDGATKLTKTFGTVTYMPPELLGEDKLSFKGDVYSFGVLMYEMITSKVAFEGMTASRVIAAKVGFETEFVCPDDMPPPLVTLMQRCLVRAYHTRPDFTEIVSILRNVSETIGDMSRSSHIMVATNK